MAAGRLQNAPDRVHVSPSGKLTAHRAPFPAMPRQRHSLVQCDSFFGRAHSPQGVFSRDASTEVKCDSLASQKIGCIHLTDPSFVLKPAPPSTASRAASRFFP